MYLQNKAIWILLLTLCREIALVRLEIFEDNLRRYKIRTKDYSARPNVANLSINKHKLNF